jgi:hypothetical protein
VLLLLLQHSSWLMTLQQLISFMLCNQWGDTDAAGLISAANFSPKIFHWSAC